MAFLLRALALLMVFVMSPAANALTLRVGVPDFRPDIYLQSDGRPGGVLGDVLSEIAAAENWTLDARDCYWDDCLAQLEAGAIDLLPNVQYTPQRAKIFGFPSVPVLLRSSRLYALDTMGLDTLEQLDGKRIAVLAGSAQLDTLQSMLAQMQVAATLVSVEDLGSAFDLVSRHEADAAIADSVFGALAAPRHHLKATPIEFPSDEVFYATRADIQPAVLTAIDRHLDAWKADPNSVYYKVLDRWGQTIPEHRHPWYLHWAVLVLLVILLLAVVGYGLYQKRRRPLPYPVFSPGAEDARNLEHDLAVAIENKRLTLYIQPQFAADGQAVGAELLARWQHPVHGPISPAEFIPIAEARGVLEALTRQFLRNACQTILSLQALDRLHPVSLNISPKTLLDPGFAQEVRDILLDTGAPADYLIFEITEEIAIQNMTLAVQHMNELAAYGI
ncbi:MAG: EAL domain-containing protein, partial [Castellaniella sp.]